jgi:hypothetical protein
MSATGEIARGNYFAGLVMAGQGAADLAEGLNYTVIPAVKGAATAFTRSGIATVRDTAAKVTNAVVTRTAAVAQRVLNAAMRANPIGLVITAILLLVGAFIYAYKHSETFRRIVNAAFASVKNAGMALWNGLKAAFNGIVSAGSAVYNFFRGLPGKIGGFLKGLPGMMLDLGKKLIRNFIDGLKSMAGAIVSAISDIIPGPIKSFLHLGSPAKQGPMSEDGGPEHWGEKVSLFFTKGLAKGSRSLPNGLSGLTPTSGRSPAFAGLPGASGGPSITIHANTNASAADIGREVAWQLRTSGR